MLFFFWQPQIEVQVKKADFLSNQPKSEAVFQSFEFPVAAFAESNRSFDPVRLKTARFLFDRTPEGVVILDDLGFRQEAAREEPITASGPARYRERR